MRKIFFTLFFLALASCATEEKKPPMGHAALTPVSFGDLSGWDQDDHSAALDSFRHSCKALSAKAQWQSVCQAAQSVDGEDGARNFFVQQFRAYAVSGDDGTTGLFTGYYAPDLNGAAERGGAYQTPLYARPMDLVGVDLGLFKEKLKGQHIVGKVVQGKKGATLVLYDDRATIAKGSLEGRAQPIAWIDDPVGAFFLEVQGSGRVRLADGATIPVGYDGANGRSYIAIGKIMADRGDVPRPVTMPSIKAWLAAHPDQAQQVLNQNPSYVFFRVLPNDDVIGAEGVALTAGRSMAVDPSSIPLGAPLWIDTYDGEGARLQKLVIAQDTGGAIKGMVRGDYYWGRGTEAGTQAGAMQSKGRYYVLLPRNITPSNVTADLDER